MAFSSFDFIFVFLPVFLILYYLVPASRRSLVLLAGSAVFYAYGTVKAPFSMVLLGGLTVLTYYAARGLVRVKKKTGETVRSTFLLCVMLVLMFGLLLFYKYSGLLPHGVSLALPLGISFYVFSISGYLVDVYRGKMEAERSFVRYAACVLMFPKLLSGPIAPLREVNMDMREADTTETLIRLSNVDDGLRTFLFGLGLKVLIADRLSGLWNEVGGIGYESLSVPMAWLGVLAFSLRLYFDFWGYSLMAMGVGEMLGYDLPENFKHPYAARTMTDFWRRWHVTLGAWFKEYIYIPLGGSRCAKWRMFFNMGVVWLATGIWHGATANFLLWAGFLFLLICLEKLLYGKFLESEGKAAQVISHVYMIPVILFSWLLFAVTDLDLLRDYAVRLFSFGERGVNPMDWLGALTDYGVYLAAGIAFSVPAVPRFFEKKVKHTWVGTVLLLLVFVFAMYSAAMGQNDPFMYFGF